VLYGAVPSAQTEPAKRVEPAKVAKSSAAAKDLVVKRFLVTSGVEQREPLVGGEPLVANGKPIYAFAELENIRGEEQEVSIVFEKEGSDRRVGFATLKVPANVPRHRTWANTRNISEPGNWDAVLVSTTGVELSRTSFEVAPAQSQTISKN
jgi:hypothetical protein